MIDKAPDIHTASDDEWYGHELRRAGDLIARMKRERDEAREWFGYAVEAAGGELVIPRSLIVAKDVQLLRHEDHGLDDGIRFTTLRPVGARQASSRTAGAKPDDPTD